MPSSRLRILSPAMLLALLAAASGCSRSPATPPAEERHPVAIEIQDALGQRVEDPVLLMIQSPDSPDPLVVLLFEGRFATSLPNGVSSLHASLSELVGGTVIRMPDDSPAAPESLRTAITLAAAGAVHGVVRLAGRTSHEGVDVSTFFRPPGPLGIRSEADGSWIVGGFPPGRWTLLFEHTGFATGLTTVTVPAPGDTVDAGEVTLVSSP